MSEPISLQGVDSNGVPVKLRARLVEVKQPITKAVGEPNPDAASSNALGEEELFSQLEGLNRTVEPPYNLQGLARYPHRSTILLQNINAMVVNTVGFGWQLREVKMPEEVRAAHKTEIETEKFKLEHFLKHCNFFNSLTHIRKQEHFDKYTTGNGYVEIVRSPTGKIVNLNHVLGHAIRMTYREDDAVEVAVKVALPHENFKMRTISSYVRFRRYVMFRGSTPVFFKQAGDPRILDKRTGEYTTENLPIRYRATELIHNRIYDPTTPYGVPYYIGTVLGIDGSRKSEEINHNTMNSNAIPSAMVIVENGQLTEDSIKRLQEFIQSQVQSDTNYSKFLLIEGESLEEGSMAPMNLRIRIEPMKRLQQTDEMFQDYDQNNREKTRQSFRLPPLFSGNANDYKRDNVSILRDIADEQVFAPERDHTDDLINRYVLNPLGVKYHRFRSLNPNVTDDTELIRLMGMAERSGAMTPRRADRIIRDVFGDDIGQQPQGIDLDIPFTIQFANAQNGALTNLNSSATSTSDNLLGDLMKLNKSVDGSVMLPFTSQDELLEIWKSWES